MSSDTRGLSNLIAIASRLLSTILLINTTAPTTTTNYHLTNSRLQRRLLGRILTASMSSHQIPLHDTPRALSYTPRQHTPNRSRPTTPLRPSSRSSLRSSHSRSNSHGRSTNDNPLEEFEPAFAELSDSMADLEANFMHLQLMHESLARFSENFAGFLYGLNMNAFCVDFPEVSYERRGGDRMRWR